MDITLALMTGIDIPIPSLQLILHQPTIKEISYMGEEEFFTAINCICLEKNRLIQDKTLSASLNNFQILMKVLEEQPDKKKILIDLFSLIFPTWQVMITSSSILMLQGDNSLFIDEHNFEDLQKILTDVFCLKTLFKDSDNIVYNPQSEAAKRIANKINKGREKLSQIKKEQHNSILVRYVSILTVGISSMSLNDCINLTLFQIFDLMDRYNAWYENDVDLRIKLAGGDSKAKIENWMRNIH